MNGYVYVGNNPVNLVDPLGLWAPSPYAVMHGKHSWEYGAWTGDALNDAISQVADEVIPVRETVSAYQAGDYASLAWTFVSNFIKPLQAKSFLLGIKNLFGH